MTTEDDTFEALQLHVVINEHGNKWYYNDKNQLHRKYGPAVIKTNGSKAWYINGLLHRTDGPAVIYANGQKVWYLNGEYLTEDDFLAHPLCTIK